MRKHIVFALLLTIVAQGAWAEFYPQVPDSVSKTMGPWTYEAYNNGVEGNYSQRSFNSFGHEDWSWLGEKRGALFNNGDGIGFWLAMEPGPCSHYGIYSTYKHDELVPSYTRKRLTWKFILTGFTNYYPQKVALYAHNNLNTLKNMDVDFTCDNSNHAGESYCIGVKTQTNDSDYPPNDKRASTSELTKTFDFDNSTGSSEQTKSWYLMLTHSMREAYCQSTHALYMCHQWGSFTSNSASWETFYYKHITFDANGGTGTMAVQTIENSANLTANTFTRYGFTFAGWATSKGGSKVYNDGQSITAAVNDKGLVTLYAKWTPSVAGVIAEIDAIGTPITLASLSAIEYAREGYNGLSSADKALVTNYATLENAEAAYDVVVLIAAIPGTIVYTEECHNAILAVRAAYNALTETQQELVSNYATLTAAESAYSVLDAKDKIAAIGEVSYTAESKAKIDVARATYDELTEAEKARMTAAELETLQAAEATYAALAPSTLEFKGKDGTPTVDSQEKAIYYPALPAGTTNWQTVEKNVSEDKTIVIKAE